MSRFSVRVLAGSARVAVLAGLLLPVAALYHRPASAAAAGSCDVDAARLAPDAEEQTVLDQTNTYRTSQGLPPLRLSLALTRNALWKSTDMATHSYAAHDDSFRTWSQRFSDCGYDTTSATIGENLAGGNAGGAATLVQWQNSPHHNENLLDPQFTAVGIKRVRAAAGDPYGWYWSMELGSRLDTDLTAALTNR